MKKILIVDDQVSMAMILSDILEEDFKVVTAANGEVGITKAIKEQPDLIVMDIMMPVKDGITAIRELRAMEEFKNTPIFILSAKGGSHDANLVEELRISGFIGKPFSPSIILEQFKKALL